MKILPLLPGILLPGILTVVLAAAPSAEAATRHRVSRAYQPPSYSDQAPPQSGAPIRTPCWPCV
jgi:hypothetical protein